MTLSAAWITYEIESWIKKVGTRRWLSSRRFIDFHRLKFDMFNDPTKSTGPFKTPK